GATSAGLAHICPPRSLLGVPLRALALPAQSASPGGGSEGGRCPPPSLLAGSEHMIPEGGAHSEATIGALEVMQHVVPPEPSQPAGARPRGMEGCVHGVVTEIARQESRVEPFAHRDTQ